MACAALGGWLGYFLGGMDGLLIALIVFMVLNYINGLIFRYKENFATLFVAENA